MKDIIERAVYYADTDAYGVVWHGTYLRWMEQGRVEFCKKIGLDLLELKEKDVVIPVTNINVRYKSSAKIDEKIEVVTEITDVTPLTVQFTQTIKNKESGRVYTIGKVDIVAVNGEGKIYRKMPEVLKNTCQKAMTE